MCESIVDEQAELVHVVVGIGNSIFNPLLIWMLTAMFLMLQHLWHSGRVKTSSVMIPLTRALIERIAYYLNNHLVQYDAAAMRELAKEYSATIGRHIIVQSVRAVSMRLRQLILLPMVLWKFFPCLLIMAISKRIMRPIQSEIIHTQFLFA